MSDPRPPIPDPEVRYICNCGRDFVTYGKFYEHWLECPEVDHVDN